MSIALSLQDLSKTYANGTQALKGINLEIRQGDFFALLGPNGAGKSTTIGIISSLVNKSTGVVEIFGHNLEHDPVHAKSHLGLVPQEFNFNVFEPVEEIIINQAGYYGIPRPVARQRANELMAMLDLTAKRRVMARELSGGMKRRLMIARALVHKPKLLILDEPTAGVDIELRRSTWAFLKRLNEEEGTTIILTTHYLEEAEQLCRNIAIINHGKIVAHSSMRELLSKLNVETFVLNTVEPFSDLPALSQYTMRRKDEHEFEVDVVKGNTLNDLFAALAKANIHIASMRNKSNRLEELFIHLLRQ